MDLLATKLIGSSSENAQQCYIAHIPSEKRAFCPVKLLLTGSRHSSALVLLPAAETWCGSQLSNSLAPGSVQPLKLALPSKPRSLQQICRL